MGEVSLCIWVISPTLFVSLPQQICFISNLLCFPNKITSFPQQLESLPQQLESLPQQLVSLPQHIFPFPQQLVSLPQHIFSFPQQLCVTLSPTKKSPTFKHKVVDISTWPDRNSTECMSQGNILIEIQVPSFLMLANPGLLQRSGQGCRIVLGAWQQKICAWQKIA